MQALKGRKILEDDRRGRQLIEVEQDAKWSFLCFGGTFTTKLYVKQNKVSREVRHNSFENWQHLKHLNLH